MFKVGDKVKFRKWEDWEEKNGIKKSIFETCVSYDDVYVVTYVVADAILINDRLSYVYHPSNFISNKPSITLPENLFKL